MPYGDEVGVLYVAVACPNPDCKKLTLVVNLTTYVWGESGFTDGKTIHHWDLLPDSQAKPQPDYIPNPIVQDYNEACRILSLSPKASAALARRCLQGMIRDFWNISKSTLNLEIKAPEDKVTPDVWEAIDSVRSVGNIGAHFEKDVNLIVEIEPEEADLLIKLIEDLFIDWYITQHDRQERQSSLRDLAQQKQALRKPGKKADKDGV
jgi:hypothetical protein